MKGFMYALTAESGNIKVGFTKRPANRIPQIEKLFGVKAVEVLWMEAIQADEYQFHRDHRAKCLGQEWYGPEIKAALIGFRKAVPKKQAIRCLALKVWRERRNYTQDELASLLGVSKQCVHQWEAGKTVISDRDGNLSKVVQLTGIPLTDLRPDVFRGAAA